ncbi:MAG: hypothetical protein ACJA13_004179 [Paraglaciecola sp.]
MHLSPTPAYRMVFCTNEAEGFIRMHTLQLPMYRPINKVRYKGACLVIRIFSPLAFDR